MTVTDGRQGVELPQPAPATDDHWTRAWADALDAVELDLGTAEGLLRDLHAGSVEETLPAAAVHDWFAPDLAGPVPQEFAARARRLLQRQQEVSEDLAAAIVHARAQRRGLGKLEPAERRPVFVDKAL